MHVTVNHVATSQNVLLACNLTQPEQAQTHFPPKSLRHFNHSPRAAEEVKKPRKSGGQRFILWLAIASLKLNLFAEESQNYSEMGTSDYFHFNLFVAFETTAHMHTVAQWSFCVSKIMFPEFRNHTPCCIRAYKKP